ncbi:glycosyltransferase family 2 protein [Aquirufa sp.]|jgi:hypothetical protein|uniref:glycosyltransferase family 2 protein n=1 Tax=Aquirufa sp. TaxID=2676249 RepID=UPI0037C18183
MIGFNFNSLKSLFNDSNKYLNKDFNFYWNKLINGENFTFLRYADGERAIMTGVAVSAQEGGWSSPNFISRLGKDLLQSMTLVDRLAHYAVSCPCCDEEAYYWYNSRLPNKENITFANLWINNNYGRFVREFDKLTRDAVVITNYRALNSKIGSLNILKFYEVGDDCINFWEESGDKLVNQIISDFGGRNDLLFVVSAGPMSEPIIYRLFQNNRNNTYIDFGSSIDRYYRGAKTRPYENRWSKYGRRNCSMPNPTSFNMDVSCVLTVYKRPDQLTEQIKALENQTLKPKEIIIFHDKVEGELEVETSVIDSDLVSNHIKVDRNVGVWGRFAGGLLSKSKYVCFFDDDTIPGSRWLENCHTHIIKRKGLYGTIGIDSWNLKNYPFRSFRRWGWDGPSKSVKEVDLVGHSWFLEKDWLGVMWINSRKLYEFKYVGEDMFLSFSLKKWLGIKTYVPPHPPQKVEYYGSQPKKALEYGQQKDIAIGYNDVHFRKMNSAINQILKMGFSTRNFNFINLFKRDSFSDLIAPDGSMIKNLLLKIFKY